jgi:hypothetical protein
MDVNIVKILILQKMVLATNVQNISPFVFYATKKLNVGVVL